MYCAHISPRCWRPGGENHKAPVDVSSTKKRVFGAVQAAFHRQLPRVAVTL